MISLTVDVTRHGQTIATESHVIGRRADLVQITDGLILQHRLSGRARRQVNLVRIWQCLAMRGNWKWSIHDTCGDGIKLRFLAAS